MAFPFNRSSVKDIVALNSTLGAPTLVFSLHLPFELVFSGLAECPGDHTASLGARGTGLGSPKGHDNIDSETGPEQGLRASGEEVLCTCEQSVCLHRSVFHVWDVSE